MTAGDQFLLHFCLLEWVKGIDQKGPVLTRLCFLNPLFLAFSSVLSIAVAGVGVWEASSSAWFQGFKLKIRALSGNFLLILVLFSPLILIELVIFEFLGF